jgi:plastocyanin
MKKIINLFLLFLTGFLFVFTSSSHGKTWNVNVSDFVFTPSNITVSVGDTVKWQWISGIHTTTSITVPSGAATWDEPITISNQTYRYVVTVAGSYHYKCTPHFPGMEGFITANPIGIEPKEGKLPNTYKLFQNYPNPFNPVTDIKFELPNSSFVKLTVFNMLGGEVEVLVSQQLNAGGYIVDWDASRYSSGIYFYKLETDGFSAIRKMTLIK